MNESTDALFEPSVWGTALEKYGAVTQLSVTLFDAREQIVCGPVPATPIVAAFRERGYEPGLFVQCARACLAQPSENRAPVLVSQPSGLAVIGVSLVLHGNVVGALVAGYALTSFCDAIAIARLARECGMDFHELWSLARRQQPVPARRLVVHGELLDVLGSTLLRLSHLATHDPLTDLPNRLLLADRLAHALAVAQRHQRPLAVLFLDVDRFKHINDSLGHAVGDELLRAVAREVTRCVRSSDTVARLGGDEFVVVLSELAHADDAEDTAQKIIAALARPHAFAGHELRITVSIGISLFPQDGGDAETLITRADLALYHAKEQGRACCKFFEPHLTVRAIERQSIEAGLHLALDQKEFELLYQPKMNLTVGTVIGAEALIRWRHPARGVLAPAEFIPIAEDCGLIRPIGRWVLQEACRQVQAWRKAGLRAIPVSVNISAAEFGGEGFLDSIVDTLTETGMDPSCLEIELTESVLMANVEATTTMLHAIKALGVRLAVDDFGTGCSSLSYLRHFPIDALKIDKSFVHEITFESTSAFIVSAVISLGASLNLRVIAEGVETHDQLAFLRAERCGEGQGYYFSQPLLAQQFAQMLEIGARVS